MMGHFDDLHPEYEVLDWRGWPYFVDFAWKPGQVKFAFEVKRLRPTCAKHRSDALSAGIESRDLSTNRGLSGSGDTI